MRPIRSAAMAALAATLIAAPATAFADGCLQKFSCQVYGECRLPCLDELTGAAPAAPPTAAAALDREPTASLPSQDGRAVATDDEPPREPTKAKRHASRERTKATRHTASKPHIVAARDVTSLAALAGKPVSFGPAGSASQALGRKLFAKLDIKVQETPLEVDNALDGVATGDVAAVLVVKPKDVARIEKLPASGGHELAVPDDTPAQPGAPAGGRDAGK